MSVRLDDAIPILRVFHEAKPREFYLDFRVDWGREITVPDPSGNRITFCELRHSSTENGAH